MIELVLLNFNQNLATRVCFQSSSEPSFIYPWRFTIKMFLNFECRRKREVDEIDDRKVNLFNLGLWNQRRTRIYPIIIK